MAAGLVIVIGTLGLIFGSQRDSVRWSKIPDSKTSGVQTYLVEVKVGDKRDTVILTQEGNDLKYWVIDKGEFVPIRTFKDILKNQSVEEAIKQISRLYPFP